MESKRINKVMKILREKNIEGILISNFYNILYLFGFKTLTKDEREAWALITQNNNYLFTDGRYFNKVSNIQFPIFKIRLINSHKSLINHFREIIKKEKITRFGFEEDDLRFIEYKKLKEKLPEAELVPTEKLIIRLREIKEREEVEKIKKACQITNRCLREIINTIKVGQTEKEISFKIECWLKEKGFSLAFDPIVAIDKNSSLPHYVTEDGFGRVKNQSIILIDIGTKYQDYLSDVTRIVFVGRQKNEVSDVYNRLLTIQKETINYLEKSKETKNVDVFCRKLMSENHLPNYSHSTGHGIGLEIHEYPKISKTSVDLIKPGQVFTIEPGVYFEGRFGMRIEDTVWIDDARRVKIFT